MNKLYPLSVWAASMLLMTACGGGSSTTAFTPTTTTVTGQAIAGAVTGSVTVKDATGAAVGSGSVVAGLFAVPVSNAALAGELDFEVTGNYRDEVSGSTVTLTALNPLALRAPAGQFSAGGNAPITPDSTVVYQLAKGGKTLAQATTSFQTAFGYAPDLTAKPFDPYATAVISATATAADKDAAFRAGMMSQLGSNLGLSAADLAELPSKLAADLSDGVLDGVAAGNPVTFTSGVNLQAKHQLQPLANQWSMTVSQFSSSANNVAKVAAPAMGLPPIHAYAAGTTQIVVLADGMTSIQAVMDVVYASPFQAGFRSTKTSHKITLTDAATNAPIDVTAAGSKVNGLMVMPMMYMNSGMNHPTPMTMVNTAQAAQGIYTVDLFYVMATAMAGGMPMGQWQLDVKLSDTTSTNMMDPYAHTFFYPNVMMNMGTDVLSSKVSHVADTWTAMTGITAPRSYTVWLQDIAANALGGHDLALFISTQNMPDMNMGGGMVGGMAMGGVSFPPVAVGTALNGAVNGMGMRPAKTVATVLVEVSPDAGVTWTTMTADAMAKGVYRTAGLVGWTTGAAATLAVRLTVDGNVMTTAAAVNPTLSFTAP